MSKLRSVTNGISQGSLLRPALFNIFVGTRATELSAPSGNFADCTHPCGVVEMLQGRDDIQRDLDRFEILKM